MSIKDKQTYGEYYWAMQVEAQKAFGEEAEKQLAPYIAGLLADAELPEETPASILDLIPSLPHISQGRLESPHIAQTLQLFPV